MEAIRRYRNMTKAKEYKLAEERGWREQALPIHEKFFEMTDRISACLEQTDSKVPMPVKKGLSAVVQTAVDFVYREWIERKADYPQALHDAGVLKYAEITWNDRKKPKPVKVYLRAETVEKIDSIGNYLDATKYNTPYLMSTGHKGVYNRKMIIILCMNALSESLKG